MAAVKTIVAAGAVVLASQAFHFYRKAREETFQELLIDTPDRDALFKSRHEQIAETYDTTMDSYEWAKRIDKYRYVLCSYAEGKVLEVAIGTGRNWGFYPKECRVIGIDWSEKMLAVCDRKQVENKQVLLMPMDARKLKFPDQTFDTVVATFALSSCPDPEKMLAEMVRVCKSQGRILVLEKGMGTGFLANTLLEMYRYEYLMEYGYDQYLDIETIVQKANVTIEVEEHKQAGQLHFYLLRPKT